MYGSRPAVRHVRPRVMDDGGRDRLLGVGWSSSERVIPITPKRSSAKSCARPRVCCLAILATNSGRILAARIVIGEDCRMSKWNPIVSGRRAWAALRDSSRRWCPGVGSEPARRVTVNGSSAGTCRARQIIAERPANAARIGAMRQLDGDQIRLSGPKICELKIPLPIPCRARKIPLADDLQNNSSEGLNYLIRMELSARRATNFAPRCDAFGIFPLTAGEFCPSSGLAVVAARPGDFGRLLAARRLAAVAKEGAQQLAGALLLDAAVNLGPVVGGRLLEEARPVLDCPALWVVGAEIKPAKASQADRRGAHRAWFEGDVEIAIGEVLGAEPRRTSAQHQHLGVCGRIAIGLDPVAGGGENAAVAIDEYGADRHLAARRRRFGFGKGECHRRGPRGHPLCQRRIGSGIAIGRRVERRMNNPSCSASA